ncbi:MAG TPA: 6-phosphogluconolactonase [Nitrospirales bacterium]|nr:6-phosphogluconolactonase [Nitrospiraceae bacterium]HNP29831.1 6-phosphogluconolactonase [Nitrospirales bacterium]
MSRTIIITPTIDELFVAAAKEVVQVVVDCRKAGRACRVALAGGSTPRGLYRLLTGDPYRTQVSWNHLRIFWGDERTVPPDHEESNFRMAEEALLSHMPIPSNQVFRIEGELPAGEAAARYEAVLREQFGLSSGEVPRFDLILLGMGPDGHTASLFPGTSAVAESQKLVAAPWVEKLHTHRVTLTPPVLNAAKHVVFLVGGGDKAPALQAVLEGPADPARYPAQVVNPSAGHLVWLVNQDAAGLLNMETRTSRV